jgi:ATPase subunit of ABC transporter with duplicated ATPase domains
MVNSPSRLLLLDEPDVVEEALRAYAGTLVMVTHDAWFARAVGYRRRWEVGAGRVVGLAACSAVHCGVID